MTTVIMILILFQLMQAAPVLDQIPIDPQAGAVDDGFYAVNFLPDGQGADIQVPPVLGRSPMYSTESVGKGLFLLQFESLTEDGMIRCRYDLLDLHRQTVTKLYETTSKTQGSYAEGFYDPEREQLIHTFFGEVIQRVDKTGAVHPISGQYRWYAASPNKRWLVVQKHFEQGNKTTLVDLEDLSEIDCPKISPIEYIFYKFVAHFSPDSEKFYSMPKVFGDTINIFDSATGEVVKKVTIKDALLTTAVWSPDGKQLAFEVENQSSTLIQQETINLPVIFSRRLGLYDSKSHLVSEFVIPSGYIVEAPRFTSDGRYVFLKTASEAVCRVWSSGGEERKAQPVTLNVLDLESGTLTPLVDDFMEGIQSGFSSHIQGIHYRQSEAWLFRQVSETVTDLYQLSLETGEEKVLMRFQSSPNFKIIGDSLVVSGVDGMYRIPLDDSGMPEWMGSEGLITPDGEAIFREWPNAHGSVFTIRKLPQF